MQFAGQFIVQCLPVAVICCVCIVYTLANFCCLCAYVCVRVSCVRCASLFYAAIKIFR